MDEAGRGPLAGPVVAAAVILCQERAIEGLRDSKEISPTKRELLEKLIRENALAWAVGVASAEEIDRGNILQASLTAMRRALRCLDVRPDLVLVDGKHVIPRLSIPQRAVVDGDATEPCIAAASVLAKVWRDRVMRSLDTKYPGYGFAHHKGYYCKQHLLALASLGPCPEHRKSFAPVAQRTLELEYSSSAAVDYGGA